MEISKALPAQFKQQVNRNKQEIICRVNLLDIIHKKERERQRQG